MGKITISTLRKFERLQQIYEAAKAISLQFGADKKQFSATDESLSQMGDVIKRELSGGIARPQ